MLFDLGVMGEWLGADRITTFRGGGRALVAMPDDEGKLLALLDRVEREGVRYRLLGGGSDIVICDGVASTLLISTRALSGITFEGEKVTAQCGARLADIGREAMRRGLGGLEFMAGVPATLGGALALNAGAFGDSIAAYVREVELFAYGKGNAAAGKVSLPAENIRFGYRRGVEGAALGATLELVRRSAEESAALMRKYIALRRAKQPSRPSCGSVFVNGETPSGRLIEECGLKGATAGGAQISPLHANFIVNTGGATASDFLALVELCEREALKKFGVRLQREFVLIV